MSASGLTDADGDSHMHSSGSETDQMFPGESGPRTPQHPSSQLAHSALSPPGSQGPSRLREADIIMGASDQIDGTSGEGSMTNQEGKGEAGKEEEKAPGWGWTNPKAKEDYERSFAQVIDRDFSLKEFGELLDEQEVIETTGLKI